MAVAARLLAGVFFLVALLAIITDVTRSNAAQTIVVTSLFEQWRVLAPQALASAQTSLRRAPFVWDYLVRPMLLIPTWSLFISLGLLLAYLGRRRHKVNIFAN